MRVRPEEHARLSTVFTAVVRARTSRSPTLTHDHSFEVPNRNRVPLTVSVTVQFCTFPKLNLSNTFSIIRDEKQCCMTPTEQPVAHRVLLVDDDEALQSNLNSLDFSLRLPDVMTIADEEDAQLTQSTDSYMKVMQKAAAA
jgi:hypothetical protein